MIRAVVVGTIVSVTMFYLGISFVTWGFDWVDPRKMTEVDRFLFLLGSFVFSTGGASIGYLWRVGR